MPLTSHLVEHDNLRFSEFSTIGHCPFCGLGNAVSILQAQYHAWCVIVHFSNSFKCMHLGCEEKMHDAWWSFIGI
jgi:hypothetical protein